MTIWDTSCRDWAQRIKAGASLVPQLPLVAAEAERALAIFDRLRLPDVPGQPCMAGNTGEWQRDIVRSVFGSYDPATRHRHINEFFCLVPKKSSKTTGSAAIMLTALLRNRRPNAEFLIIAPTKEISALAFNQMTGMIQADPVLSAKFLIQEHIKKITFRPNGAFVKIKSFDPKVVTGAKPAGVLLDELHVIAEKKDADRVLGQLRGGLLPNPEAFMIMISTQSERPPSGVFKSALTTARDVRDGKIQLPLLPVIYEFPDGVDWRDPGNWAMVTPNNGYSITVGRLMTDYHQAVASGEQELRRWASQHLNVEIGMNLRSDGWAGAELWQQAARPGMTLDAIIARSDVVTVGIDGGGLDDLLGVAVIGRDAETRQWLHWGKAYAHPVALERRIANQAEYADFERDGDLEFITDFPEDYAAVVALIESIHAAGKLGGVGIDKIGAYGIVDDLAAIEVTQENNLLYPIAQGIALGGVFKGLERKLADRSFVHCGQALMRWCVGNMKIIPTKTAWMVARDESGAGKIDPAIAMANAAALMERNPIPAGGPSVYDNKSARPEGLLVF